MTLSVGEKGEGRDGTNMGVAVKFELLMGANREGKGSRMSVG